MIRLWSKQLLHHFKRLLCCLLILLLQASSFFNKNLTNADNDNSMNMSTKMEMSQVNKPANKVQTMQYDTNIQTPVGVYTYSYT